MHLEAKVPHETINFDCFIGHAAEMFRLEVVKRTLKFSFI